MSEESPDRESASSEGAVRSKIGEVSISRARRFVKEKLNLLAEAVVEVKRPVGVVNWQHCARRGICEDEAKQVSSRAFGAAIMWNSHILEAAAANDG